MTADERPLSPRFNTSVKPITASDDELRTVLACAELPPLLPALAYCTGDMGLLRDDLRPDPERFAEPQGGLSAAQQDQIRELALEALVRFRDAGSVPAPRPADADLTRIAEHAVGVRGLDAYLPLVAEELAHGEVDLRAPSWSKPELAPTREFRVIVVGAGMSGLLAAHRLRQAGIEFTVIEKNESVGGTWFENRYPGCRVDNSNHSYSYSFAQRHDWPFHYSTHDVLRDYFDECADELGVREHIRFRAEVRSLVWSDESGTWQVSVRDLETGRTDTLRAHAVISAVGQLNRPSVPDIEGRDDFTGQAFHSARWPEDLELGSRRVAVIGTGASAMQLIPEVARHAGEVVVFQRTPAWLGPTPDYHEPVPEGLNWLYSHVPSYSQWNRFCIWWRMGDSALPRGTVDPSWNGDGRSVSAANERWRTVLSGYLAEQFADRPDLLPAVTPSYPPGAKRVIRDNGIWAETLKRSNVELVTTPIERITETGVCTSDGRHREFDLIVYGTGFQASRFLVPMTVVGQDGKDLHGCWGDDARAYLGITIPGFPNFFCLYGPNTNIVVNGSIIFLSECGVRYIMSCLETLLRDGRTAMSLRQSVHDSFNEWVDRKNEAMVWGAADVNSWYKSTTGRISQNWPASLLEYWTRTRSVDPDDYTFQGPAVGEDLAPPHDSDPEDVRR